MKIFNESIKRHLGTSLSPLRTALDPLKLFPLEFKFKNDLYRYVSCVFLHLSS